jgi:8-oxo-dGTP diphosphatase
MTLPSTPALATDCVIFNQRGRVLLIRRGHEPCAGKHALTGGFVKIGETVVSACRREVKEETGIAVAELTLVGVYSDIDRDPRGCERGIHDRSWERDTAASWVRRDERRMGRYARR